MMHPVYLFFDIGGGEIILIMLVALLLFGGDKLPELARGLGKGIRDFKDASEGVKREIQNQINQHEETKVAETKAPETTVTETPVAENHEETATTPVQEVVPNHVPNTIAYNDSPVVANDDVDLMGMIEQKRAEDLHIVAPSSTTQPDKEQHN